MRNLVRLAALMGAFGLGYLQGGPVLGLFLSGLALLLGRGLAPARPSPPSKAQPGAEEPKPPSPEASPVEVEEAPQGLSSEQERAFLAVTQSPHPAHLITGPAGTSKTTLLYALQEFYKGRAVTLAPTGTAALQARGQTVHSFFRFPARLLRHRHPEDIRPPGPRTPLRKAMEQMEVLILDEVGMVRVDLLEAVDWALRKARRRLEEPFGGSRFSSWGIPASWNPWCRAGKRPCTSPAPGEDPFSFRPTCGERWH
ncbi:AAA family ATPase [Thermus sp.]|uniref:AAA family ATPase n=1 Tax=Thermus sp. TaxID=275 RepID=UPI00307DA412